MPTLLCNIKIDSQEKYELFKLSLSDLLGLFSEYHIKIRGAYLQECVEYAGELLGGDIHLYQEIQGSDWVAATLEMLDHVKSRSVFLYFEDHMLTGGKKRLDKVLVDFDKYGMDYLCYSFFKASQLEVSNLLPLGVTQREMFHEFSLSAQSLNLIEKIRGPHGYYTFSLISLISIKYLKEIISSENKLYKIYNRGVVSVITRLFPYPRYRKVFRAINNILSLFRTMICIYPPSSPFNLEKIWFESSLPIGADWKFAILKQELFANHDDDNGAYGESLIKRGLYPLDACSLDTNCTEGLNSVEREIFMDEGEIFDCTYYSHKGRISCVPCVEINVVDGNVIILYQDSSFPLFVGETRLFYSNLGPVIQCVKLSKLKIKIFDEAF